MRFLTICLISGFWKYPRSSKSSNSGIISSMKYLQDTTHLRVHIVCPQLVVGFAAGVSFCRCFRLQTLPTDSFRKRELLTPAYLTVSAMTSSGYRALKDLLHKAPGLQRCPRPTRLRERVQPSAVTLLGLELINAVGQMAYRCSKRRRHHFRVFSKCLLLRGHLHRMTARLALEFEWCGGVPSGPAPP